MGDFMWQMRPSEAGSVLVSTESSICLARELHLELAHFEQSEATFIWSYKQVHSL